MDHHGNSTTEKLDSILEVDGFHLNRIISRESSVGQSCHIYYRDCEGVPFKWEMQPGTPKNRRKDDVIPPPPPTPPPAVQSSWLPKPNWVDELPKDSKHSISKFLFWKKHKKGQQAKAPRVEEFEMKSNYKYDQNSEFGDSDGEFMGWVNQDSSYSASSSSSTSSNGHSSVHQSRFGREYDRNVVDKPVGCSPWNMTEVIRVRVARLI